MVNLTIYSWSHSAAHPLNTKVLAEDAIMVNPTIIRGDTAQPHYTSSHKKISPILQYQTPQPHCIFALFD